MDDRITELLSAGDSMHSLGRVHIDYQDANERMNQHCNCDPIDVFGCDGGAAEKDDAGNHLDDLQFQIKR